MVGVRISSASLLVSERSAVWLAHELWELGVVGSNPTARTSCGIVQLGERLTLVQEVAGSSPAAASKGGRRNEVCHRAEMAAFLKEHAEEVIELRNRSCALGGKDELMTRMWSMQLFRPAVERLNTLISSTGAEVVISSSWRVNKSVQRLEKILKCAGFAGSVLDKTPRLGTQRGQEIEAWIRGTRFRGSFVILDDDADMEPYMDRLVLTSMETGLLDSHVEEAKSLLEE